MHRTIKDNFFRIVDTAASLAQGSLQCAKHFAKYFLECYSFHSSSQLLQKARSILVGTHGAKEVQLCFLRWLWSLQVFGCQ